MSRPLARPLSLAAVGALALTGLAVSPAVAEPVPFEVQLVSFESGLLSLRPSQAGTFRSAARVVVVHNPGATSAWMQYNLNPDAGPGDAGWVSEAAVAVDQLKDSTVMDWTPNGWVPGARYAVRVVMLTDAGEVPSASKVVRFGDAATEHGVTLDQGTQPVVFHQPYADSNRTASLMTVSGTTSATSGTVELSWWRRSDGTFHGTSQAELTSTSIKVSSTSSDSGGRFETLLDVAGARGHAGLSDDRVIVRATRDGEDLAIVPGAGTVPTEFAVGSPQPSSVRDEWTVNLSVWGAVNAQPRPIPGVEVRRSRDGMLVGYTDIHGEVVARQATGTSESYYANLTDVDAYEPGTDVLSEDVTVEGWPRVRAHFADGVLFDADEYDHGDIAVEVVDANGEPLEQAAVVFAIFSADGHLPEAPDPVLTDEHGIAQVPFDVSRGPGSYRLVAIADGGQSPWGLEPIDFTVGQAELTLTSAVTAPRSGQSVTVTGLLAIDGQPLVGRAVDLSYGAGRQGGSAGDAALVGAGADGTLRVHTDATGRFTATVRDPRESSAAETGGVLRAATATMVAQAGSTLAGNADASASLPLSFSAVPAVPRRVSLRVSGQGRGVAADRITVRTSSLARAQKVDLLRRVNGRWQRVGTKRLSATGTASWQVPDRNRRAVTAYRVRLVANRVARAPLSSVLRLR